MYIFLKSRRRYCAKPFTGRQLETPQLESHGDKFIKRNELKRSIESEFVDLREDVQLFKAKRAFYDFVIIML